ncbi:MAB_1171c family putative transporter [Streptomyces misionensis]|uniref:MAB_1171c family putative transporter n=1 Tax=Streptomyces misionensis TaxID=67331 RepID=UPI0033AC61A8
MSDLINYVSCGLLWLGLLTKAPDLARRWRDPFLLTLSTVLALSSLCFLFGAPDTVGFVNDVSGVPNLAAPLTYGTITAYGAASLALVMRWRGGPGTTRAIRRWTLGYTAVLAGIAALFVLGDASVERRTDFDTYYATTPYIGEMIVLYLAAHLTAALVTAYRSLSWARRLRGPLRAGLVTMGVGTVAGCGYSVAKLVAVGARWGGHDWSALGTTFASACAGLSAALTVVGIVIPLFAPFLAERVCCWRTYARLGPLERALTGLLTREALRVPRPRWPSATRWLTWRQSSIYNGLHYLGRYLDEGLYRQTYADRLRAGGDPHEAQAAAWAAAIAAATRAPQERRAEAAVPLADRPDLPALLRISDALADGTGDRALAVA